MHTMARIRQNAGSVRTLLRGLAQYVAFADAGVLPDGMDEPTVTLRGVEIFRAGDYSHKNGGAYSDSDIAEMAAHWNDRGHEPPVTLDHAQHGPAYGFLSRVWAESGRLFADLKDVPQSLATAIKNRRYPKRSIEFYRDWKEKGVASIRRVTFLGAVPPGCPGMEEVRCADDGTVSVVSYAAFGDDPGELVTVEFADGEAASFADVPPDPAPDSHGIITATEHVQSNLEHHHNAYLDADGNGYTSYPLNWEWDCDGMERPGVANHVHQVVKGVVQPAGDPAHTHDLTLYKSVRNGGEPATFADGSPAADPTAPTAPTSNQKPTAAAVAETQTHKENDQAMDITPEQFADMNTRLTAAEKRAEDAEKRAENTFRTARNRENLRRFNDTFNAAVMAGRVEPAEKDELLATFNDLCSLDSAVESFDDEPKDTDPSARFLAGIAKRPVRTPMGVNFGDGPISGRSAGAADDEETRRAKEYVEAQAKQGHVVSFSDALIATAR